MEKQNTELTDSTLTSAFDHIEDTQYDPIFEIYQAYTRCEDPNKINLTLGAYRDENLQPVVFKSVRAAEDKLLAEGFSRAYLPPTGDEEFNHLTQLTVFSPDSKVFSEKRIETVQSISGSGGLRLGGEFLFRCGFKSIAIPHLTWPNHGPIFQCSGLTTTQYRYYSEDTKSLDIEGLLEDLKVAEEGSAVLLHVCGHNPTGVDPSEEDWKRIGEVLKSRDLFPFFDTAYSGYATGDPQKDIHAVHMLFDMGFEMMIAQSFSKNMGLYGERAGPLHIIVNDSSTLPGIKQVLSELALGLYLTPVGNGSRIIKTILKDEALKADWLAELKVVAGRLNYVREKLYNALKEVGAPGTWEHIVRQRGMFSYAGLTAKQCEALIEQHKIFLPKSGRISLAGLNDANVMKVASAIKDVTMNY